METDERIALIKKKIQEKKESGVIEELRSLNKSFNDLKYLITGSEKVNSIKQNEELLEIFKLMGEKIDKLYEKDTISVSNLKDLPRPVFKSPEKITVENIEEAKDKEIGINNWEKMPPVKIPKEFQIKDLDKTLEKLLPKDETPDNATMELTNNDLWKNVSINYPSGAVIKIAINRNSRDVITKLTFTRI